MAVHEECGVFGIYDKNGCCAESANLRLYALQHRGQLVRASRILAGRYLARERPMDADSPSTRNPPTQSLKQWA